MSTRHTQTDTSPEYRPRRLSTPRISSAEFDQYAPTYSTLLQDPIRDRFAAASDFFHRRKWILINEFLAKRHIPLKTLHWLDVGCGKGELLRMAGSEFAGAVGCDPSPKMLETCGSERIFQQPSSTELPFYDHSFDFITAVCVYHHVHPEQRAALTRSIYRVLKPGGIFCMVEHNPWNPVTQLIVRRCRVDVGAQLLTTSKAARLMCAADLQIIETAYFLYLPEVAFKQIGWIEKILANWPAGGQFAMFCRKGMQ